MKKDLRQHIDYKSKKLFKESFIDVFPVYEVDFPEDEYSTYDVSFKTRTVKAKDVVGCLVELKQRRVKSTDYPDTLLEKNKFDRMRNLAKRVEQARGIKCVPYYCAMFDDCFYMFDLMSVNFRVGRVNCRRTTDFSDNRMKTKEVVYFEFKNGKRYEYRD